MNAIENVTKRKREVRAFTLIELLVVMAIIAVLTSILFPVFAQAKNAAKRSVCLNQMRLISLANVMYANDYDNTYTSQSYIYFPPNRYEYHAWWGGFFYTPWAAGFTPVQTLVPEFGQFWPYMRNRPINDCPVAQENMQPAQGYVSGFGVNKSVMAGPGAPPHNTSDLEVEAETVLLGDNAGINPLIGGDGYLYQDPGIHSPSGHEALARAAGRHLKRANIAWADGHAKNWPVTIRSSFLNPAIGRVARRENVGDLIHPRCPFDSCAATYSGSLCKQDYYFNQRKPKN